MQQLTGMDTMFFGLENESNPMILATLDYDHDTRFIVTDGAIYYYINNRITPIGDS